jgi:hypothetical protein
MGDRLKERVPLRRSKHLPQRAAAAEVTRKRPVRAQVEMRRQFRARLFNEVPERDHRRPWSVATKDQHLSGLTQSGQEWSNVVGATIFSNTGTEFAFLAIIGFAAIVRLKWLNRLIKYRMAYARMTT